MWWKHLAADVVKCACLFFLLLPDLEKTSLKYYVVFLASQTDRPGGTGVHLVCKLTDHMLARLQTVKLFSFSLCI